jgi:hypothetical protein
VWVVYNQWLWLSLATKTADTTAGDALANAKLELAPASNTAPNPNVNTAGVSTDRPGDTKPKTTTLRVLDVATSVESSIISLLHFRLFKNLKIAYVLAITAWYVLWRKLS